MNRAEPSGILDELQEWVARGAEEFRAYMASPEGEELRRRVAQVLIVAAPLVFRSRFMRATWVGRTIGLLGGTALVVKVAEALRDWQPEPTVVEVGTVEPTAE